MKRRSFLALAGGGLLAAEVKLPPFTKAVLSNGITVYLLPKRDVPLVTLSVVARGGLEADPAGKHGLTALTNELLRRGTKTRTASQLAEELDFMGATLNTSANEQAAGLNAEFLAKDAARAAALVADMVLHPVFPPAEFDQQRALAIDAAKAVKDEPGQALNNYFRAFFYGAGHPYGRALAGDQLSLPRLTRDDAVAQHQRLYGGRNLTLIAVGDFEAAAMRALLDKLFASAPQGQAFTFAAPPPVARSAGPRLLLVDKPDATQTYFMIGQPGITRTDPDRVALDLINTLFGGRFTSILNDELRVNTGLTYGARSYFERNRLPGALVISTFTKTATTERAMDLALSLLKRLREQGITAQQLASAKAYVKGIYPTDRLETSDQLAALLSQIELFGLNRGEVDDLFSSIDAVTLEQANRLIKQRYSGDNLTFVLLGSAGKIRDTAKKYAPALVEVPLSKPGYAV